MPPAFAVLEERELLLDEALVLLPGFDEPPDFAEAVAFEPADRACVAVFPPCFAGVAALVDDPVDAFFTAPENLAANESSGRSRRLATTPPPSHMNCLRLAEDTPIPSSSGSVIPPPWD
ncbi:MAG: hypothetical protein U0842_18210 [Candidatus Binatia bacterium]